MSGPPRRILVMPLLLVLPLLGVMMAGWHSHALAQGADLVAADLRGMGAAGLALAVLVQVLVAASGILPASLVGIVAGALYGVAAGFGMAAASLLIGALLTFGLGRSMFRDSIARLLRGRPRMRNLDAMVAREGWRLVCLLRVSPVMPFAATSYSLGLTSIGTSAYLGGTLASLPALFGYVVVGSFANALTDAVRHGLDLVRTGLLAAGLLATVLVTLRIGQLVWRASQSAGDTDFAVTKS